MLRESYRFPIFFQLQFRSDWLIKRAVSYQKRQTNEQINGQPKQWHSYEIPTLYTPINSVEILKHKRLTLVLQLYERNKTKHVNFAYININMEEMQPVLKQANTGETQEVYELLKYDLDVIANNRVIGKFQTVINYSIVNRQDQVMMTQ